MSIIETNDPDPIVDNTPAPPPPISPAEMIALGQAFSNIAPAFIDLTPEGRTRLLNMLEAFGLDEKPGLLDHLIPIAQTALTEYVKSYAQSMGPLPMPEPIHGQVIARPVWPSAEEPPYMTTLREAWMKVIFANRSDTGSEQQLENALDELINAAGEAKKAAQP